MHIVKPNHKRYAFSHLDETSYCRLANQYSCVKRGGVRAVYVWLTGAGIWGVAKEALKGTVVQYGKRKLAAVCIGLGAYLTTPAVLVFTNATSIVKNVKRVHGTVAFVFECCEDCSNISFLPIDLALFGQPIPIGSNDRFNLISNFTDFLNAD
jgi:hypothetical protein